MAERTIPFGSMLTAVITPFTADGAVDYDAYWRLIQHLKDTGSDGIVVCGTTGESPTLTDEEKLALFSTTVEAVGGAMTVLAGTGTYDTAHSVHMTKRAAEIGCDGVMAVTPYYSRPPQEGLYQHFTSIADATDLPVLLYNIPGRTARLIEIETLVRLADHPRILAVKDAVDDLSYTRSSLEALPAEFAVYAGSDFMTRELIELGGVGVVSVASHVVGRQIRTMIDAQLAGDSATAKRIDDLLTPIFEALFVEPNPMPLKAALNEHWGSVGQPRLPLVPASDATLQLLGEALEVASTV